MPELPEVETIVRGLRPLLVGQSILGIQIFLPKTVWLDEIRATGEQEVGEIKLLLQGKKINSITRRGKMIIIHLSSEAVILVHLKMTGQLIYVGPDQQRVTGGHPNADFVRDLPVKSTRAICNLANGARLYFNDQRQFGYIKVLTSSALEQHAAYRQFGPEALGPDLTLDYLWSKAQRRPKLTVKQFLLDQSIIAGIGNIYADEALFEAKIYPGNHMQAMSKYSLGTLLDSVKAVLELGIQYGGTSSEHYLQSDGSRGSMQDHLNIYRKTGQPCPRCGAVIERTVIGGRGTHYCPQCQPLNLGKNENQPS